MGWCSLFVFINVWGEERSMGEVYLLLCWLTRFKSDQACGGRRERSDTGTTNMGYIPRYCLIKAYGAF